MTRADMRRARRDADATMRALVVACFLSAAVIFVVAWVVGW